MIYLVDTCSIIHLYFEQPRPEILNHLAIQKEGEKRGVHEVSDHIVQGYYYQHIKYIYHAC